MQKQLLVMLLLLFAGYSQAADIEGVKLADRVRMSETGPELVLNGAGVRTRVVFKVYVGALFLTQKRNTSAGVLSDTGAKRVALHLLRDVSAGQFFAALGDGLKNNHTPDQLARLEPQVKQLEAIFAQVKAAKNGDVIVLDFNPGAGTRITVNGDAKGVIAGDEFYGALLRIWLGDRPAEESLKKAMLGT